MLRWVVVHSACVCLPMENRVLSLVGVRTGQVLLCCVCFLSCMAASCLLCVGLPYGDLGVCFSVNLLVPSFRPVQARGLSIRRGQLLPATAGEVLVLLLVCPLGFSVFLIITYHQSVAAYACEQDICLFPAGTIFLMLAPTHRGGR